MINFIIMLINSRVNIFINYLYLIFKSENSIKLKIHKYLKKIKIAEPLEERHQHKESNQRLERSNPMRQEAIESKLKSRKERINKLLFDKRVSSSTHVQSCSKIEEEQDELLKPRGKGYLPLHQHQRKFHSFYRKKKQRKCWYCRSWYHLKKDCPRMCCFFC